MTGIFAVALTLIKYKLMQVNTKLTKTAILATIASGGLNFLALAGTAFVGVGLYAALTAGSRGMLELEERTQATTDAIKQSQVDIYNYRKSYNDLKGLSDRYTELTGKVVKSAAEMEELEKVTADLKSMLSEEYDLTVRANIDATTAEILATLQQAEKASVTSLVEQGATKLDEYLAGDVEDLSGTDMEGVSAYLASMLYGSDFFNASLEEQNKMMDVAAASFYTLTARIEANRDALAGSTGELKKYTDLVDKTQDKLDLFAAGLNQTEAKSTDEMRIQNAITTIGTPDGMAADIVMYEIGEMLDNSNMDKTLENYLKYYKIWLQDKEDDFVEPLMQSTSLTRAARNIINEASDAMSGALTAEEEESFWDRYFMLTDADRQVVDNYFDELAQGYGLGVANFKRIVYSDLKRQDGSSLSFDEKNQLVQLFANAGFSPDQIARYIGNMTDFTVGRVAQFLDNVKDQMDDQTFKNLSSQMFDLVTDSADPTKFINNIETMSNSVSNLMELQRKYQEEGLTAEEYMTVLDSIQDPELLSKFFEGSLTAADYMGTQVTNAKASIQEALDAVAAEIAITGPSDALLREQMIYQELINSIEDTVLNTTDAMNEYYQSQIDYIKEMNAELQQEIDLQQERMDMNRSMLSLNRQISALESDTSYGAQARLEDLRLTREQEAVNRQKFIMDMVANQQIKDLEDKIQTNIASNTATTAAGVWTLVDLLDGKGSIEESVLTVTGDSLTRNPRTKPGIAIEEMLY
jgi:hypothetical protein